jgi:DNA polymerase III epsilon subunit-like protein
MELMVDTETLGIRPGCVILQIAAVSLMKMKF